MKQVSYLVDTDWAIHYLNGREEIVNKLRSLRKEGLAISVISLAELYEGVYYSTNPADTEKALNYFLTGVSILGIEEEVCKVFGRERGRLRREGKTVSDFDLLIASTCLRWNLTLLTNNRKHYEAVKGLEIISVS
jgi:tRNA(fMet)-specific endonuclease VapC